MQMPIMYKISFEFLAIPQFIKFEINYKEVDALLRNGNLITIFLTVIPNHGDKKQYYKYGLNFEPKHKII